jgi:hypothetical protein
LYIHYSGVWDSVAIEKHPEWAVINADGKPDPNATSVFGPYADELLIPQLKEVTGAYELDGIWADGECWAAKWDYSPAAMAAWKAETGRDEAPKKPGEPHWQEWKAFHRRGFENYLRHWVDALHAFRPELQITSNWMYTTFAPLPVRVKLDYLSGDYSPHHSVDRAQTEARYLASTGMPWDLMAWGFNAGPGLAHSIKTGVQLQQEAAVVLMQGGGFQVYHQPTRSGQVIPAIIEQLGQVADFCRARQAVSHQSTSVPQVALLLSSASQLERSEAVYNSGGMLTDVDAALQAMLELHCSVDVLAEHQLHSQLYEYPLVVIPDAQKLDENFREVMVDYVEAGGNLLLLGEKSARVFEPHLGVKFDGAPAQVHTELATPDGVVNANGVWQAVTPGKARAVGYRHPTRDTRKDAQVAATINTLDQGRIGAIYGPLPGIFSRCHHPSIRKFIGAVAAELFPSPAVRVEGPPSVAVALRRTRDDRLCVHLLNRTGAPVVETHGVTDFIPAVGPITLKVRTPRKPAAVRWVPGSGELEWSWADGSLSVIVPRLEVHGVVLIEEPQG